MAASVPLDKQPFPDAAEYADSARQLATGHGFRISVDEHSPVPLLGHRLRPPRYPFGFPALLVPFVWLIDGFPHSVQEGARAIAVAYVLAVVGAAWILGGPLAAALAALFVGLSPFARFAATLVMSDTLAALLSVLMLVAVTRASRAAAAVSGALGGALVAVRTFGIVALPAVLVARRTRRLVLAAALPLLITVAIYQWVTFGSPLRTGYNYWLPGLHAFKASFIWHLSTNADGSFIFPDKLHGDLLNGVCPCRNSDTMSGLPNVFFYPAVLSGLFWVFAPPLTGAIGIWEMIRRRATPAARYSLLTMVLGLCILLPYFAQGARFVAPAASLALIYCAVGLSDLICRGVRRTPLRMSPQTAQSTYSG